MIFVVFSMSKWVRNVVYTAYEMFTTMLSHTLYRQILYSAHAKALTMFKIAKSFESLWVGRNALRFDLQIVFQVLLYVSSISFIDKHPLEIIDDVGNHNWDSFPKSMIYVMPIGTILLDLTQHIGSLHHSMLDSSDKL